MRRYDTPNVVVRITGADLTGCDVYITFRQGRKSISFGNDGFETISYDAEKSETVLEVPFGQLQTARFEHDKPTEVQASIIDYNDYRASSTIGTVTFGRQLLEVPRHHG